MLAEAQRPDRRFDGVICESIDRIARLTYQSTKIEYDLEQLGVPLIAADEPIMRSSRTGRIEKKAGMVLLRRAKQGVAEWYVLEMLEKSRNGIEIHTDQGFNVGKPPYGYAAEKIKHPVPAKRAAGQHKTRLVPDPVQGAVVALIFDLRVNEGLSYRVIAARVNQDLSAYPPPVPVDPDRALGRWSPGSVRKILINPKYTGYMVWNRRATKDKRHPGKNNPREEWVMSSKPEHPALVGVETFLAAQTFRRRVGARPDSPGAANPHRQTKTEYRLRSYVYCAACGVRMHGKRNRHDTVGLYCQPRNRPRPDGHPPAVWLREDRVMQALTTFFNTYVLGPDRAELVAASLPAAADHASRQHQRGEEAIRRRLDDINDSMDNLIRTLERTRSPGSQFAARTEARIVELDQEATKLGLQLRNHQAATPPVPANNVALLDHLPIAAIDLNVLSTGRLQRFLDAFKVEIHYDGRTRRARVQAEIAADLVARLAQTVGGEDDRRRSTPGLHRTTRLAPATPGPSK